MTIILRTFAIGLIGVLVFHLAGLPLPWLLGPIFASLLAALSGLRLKGVGALNDGMRTILGVAVGATLTPQVLASLPDMWPTLLLTPAMVLAIGLVGVPYFRRVWGYDLPTAYYASMPGGLQDMLAFGEESGANARALALIHATRVLVIVVALPFLLKGFWDSDLSAPPGAPVAATPTPELALMVICALAGWLGAQQIGMFGASILGPLILAAIATSAGYLANRPPAEAIWAAQFFIGLSVGAKYSGVTAQEVRRDLTAGVGLCILLIFLTVVFVETIVLLKLAPSMEALLAFAPGGQAEMTVLALIVGADVAFVVTHHALRLFIVILGAPMVMRVFSPKPQG